MIAKLVARARRTRWTNVAVVNLRFLIGFAFVPAALKKVLDQPFTDPANRGRFHDSITASRSTSFTTQVCSDDQKFSQRPRSAF